MMLMLERYDCDELELAMLLDESPYHNFTPMGSCGEPWRADGSLIQAATSVDLCGHAWLFVAYVSDDAATWGSRRVKLLAGGEIVRKQMTNSGVWTGKYINMRFEIVARNIFHNVIGKATKSTYRLIQCARIQPEPNLEARQRKDVKNSTLGEDEDEFFGIAEPQVEEKHHGAAPFVPQLGIGCVLTWIDETGYTEKWFVQDLSCFEEHRFCLTEYQRRPFVQCILARLAFVKDVDGSNAAPTLDKACSGHLHNLVSSLQAMIRITKKHV